MTRSRSTSRTRRPKGPGLGYGWDSRRGWQLTFFVLGRTIVSLAITPGAAAAAAAYAVAAASAAALGAGAIGATVWATAFVSQTLWDWATTSGEDSKPICSELVVQEKATAGLSSHTVHVAICGPAGSGKSSVINSLRGLRNNHPDAARVSTVETTTERTHYLGHSSFEALSLYDCPGSGTQRVPSQGYYDSQQLYLFDAVLIVWGERLGEVEINIIRACIRNCQRFYLVRSRSDEIIRRIKDDQEIEDTADGDSEAREIHIGTTASALRAELLRAETPDDVIGELSTFCLLVNKNDLRELSRTSHADDWPNPTGRPTEIHERLLLTILGKRGTATTPPSESETGSDTPGTSEPAEPCPIDRHGHSSSI